jgi:hypothetical protein
LRDQIAIALEETVVRQVEAHKYSPHIMQGKKPQSAQS